MSDNSASESTGKTKSTRETQRSVGLRTRHVLIDSSVYIRFHAGLESRLFLDLKQAVRDFGLSIHCNDLIIFEVGRWLIEQVEIIASEQRKLSRKIDSWNKRFPSGTPLETPNLDQASAGSKALEIFSSSLEKEFNTKSHLVADIDIERILDRYKTLSPPFHQRGSKEFPDAIIIESIRTWAHHHDTSVYVVSEDDAMLADTATHPNLIAVRGLAAFLSTVAETKDASIVALLDELVDGHGFLESLSDALAKTLPNAPYEYNGYMLAEAAVEGAALLSFDQSEKWAVVSVEDSVVAFVATVDVVAELTVRYVGHIEDEDGGRDYGVADWESELHGRIYFKYDRATEEISNLEFLTSIEFSDSPDWDDPFDR